MAQVTTLRAGGTPGPPQSFTAKEQVAAVELLGLDLFGPVYPQHGTSAGGRARAGVSAGGVARGMLTLEDL